MGSKLYLVVDTETATSKQAVFDIGTELIDRFGNVLMRAQYIIEETLPLAALDSFNASKVRQYEQMIEDGIEVVPFEVARRAVLDIIDAYGATFCAYNAKFDLAALNKTSQALLGCDFFEEMPPVIDIWAAALSCICKTKRFVEFAAANNCLTNSKAKNPSTGAETVYRFLTNDPEFTESHTALADCDIEAEILTYCHKSHKRMGRDIVRSAAGNPDYKQMVALYNDLKDLVRKYRHIL